MTTRILAAVLAALGILCLLVAGAVAWLLVPKPKNDFPPPPTATPTVLRPVTPGPTVIVEFPTPVRTPTPFGQIPVGTIVTVRAAPGTESALLLFGAENAQNIDQMTDISTRDLLIRTMLASGAGCAVTPPAQSKARVLGYRGNMVQLVVTEGPCNRFDGWTRTDNITP